MMNPEMAAEDMGEIPEGNEVGKVERQGYSIVTNCYMDGEKETHDVFVKPLEEANETSYPEGIFGLESLEDALRAIVYLKRQGAGVTPYEGEGDEESSESEDELDTRGGY